MAGIAYFRDLFAYDRWANEKMLDYLTDAPDDARTERLRLIFAHLIANMTPWLYLLRGRPIPADLNVDPTWSIAECRDHLAHHQLEIEAILADLSAADLDSTVRSPGPRGTLFEDAVAVILTNILLHNQHHRGQMELLIEEQNGTYFNTFYMTYIRHQSKK